ncbi:nuclear transport factor 2 family protein [Micromonospora haikouensis]|uniref:SnoaL-like domain-containing protein n=1 Tax=Micromonospora haikouensis TaxID=686309 RepID=A0A0D0VYU7_9ACTN|nr:nuclear transport factor 2 family protein [Micromonospora haikouensis]KIR65823.1 hypothetical protein TK50_10950 [Micromonospora haikouensis]
MTSSANIDLVRELYANSGSPDVAAKLMDPNIVVDITPGYPYGGVFHGYESLMGDFFGPLFQLFGSMRAEADEIYADDQGHVFVLGHYHAVTKEGVEVASRFAHVWTVENGRLVREWQTADTAVLTQALKN